MEVAYTGSGEHSEVKSSKAAPKNPPPPTTTIPLTATVTAAAAASYSTSTKPQPAKSAATATVTVTAAAPATTALQPSSDTTAAAATVTAAASRSTSTRTRRRSVCTSHRTPPCGNRWRTKEPGPLCPCRSAGAGDSYTGRGRIGRQSRAVRAPRARHADIPSLGDRWAAVHGPRAGA